MLSARIAKIRVRVILRVCDKLTYSYSYNRSILHSYEGISRNLIKIVLLTLREKSTWYANVFLKLSKYINTFRNCLTVTTLLFYRELFLISPLHDNK